MFNWIIIAAILFVLLALKLTKIAAVAAIIALVVLFISKNLVSLGKKFTGGGDKDD
ncbi:MAG: hypothetical protein RBT37_06535 [Dissulfurispiraceae bacterium]|jgi:hypothetical protein|nr:hypothetical protein [Dissulfurispiraceae bacterium]